MDSPFDSPFADGSWYYPLLERFSATTDESPSKWDPDGSGYLVDNHKRLFLERYFDMLFLPDVGGEAHNDICVLRHSNSVCTVGLAPGHHLFRGCTGHESSSSDADTSTHRLLGVDYNLDGTVNRLANSVSGRRKRGGQVIGRAPHVFAYAICDRMIRHKLVCGVPGRLLEVNPSLAYTPVSSDQCSNASSLQSLSAGCSQRPLESLIDSTGTNVGPYLYIIAPSRQSRSNRKRRYQKSETTSSNTHRSSDSEKDDGDERQNDEDNNDTANVIHSDVIGYLSELTREKALSWTEYMQLRGL